MSGSRVVDVGTPPTNFSGWTTTEVRFHNYADLSTERGEYEASPEFLCLGNEWRLKIYPGGDENSEEENSAIDVNRSNRSIKVEYGYSVKDADGKEVVCWKPDIDEFGACGSRGNSWIYDDFAKQSTLIDALINGTLVVEVRMRLVDTNKPTPLFVPQNPINKNLLELLDDEESADVVIEVGGQQDTGDNKRTKTSTTTFHANRIILKKCAPALYDMCVPSDREDVTSVPINM